jgi:hypothetical protein
MSHITVLFAGYQVSYYKKYVKKSRGHLCYTYDQAICLVLFLSITNGIDYWLRNVYVGSGVYFGLIVKAGTVTGGGAADQGGFRVSAIPCFSIG